IRGVRPLHRHARLQAAGQDREGRAGAPLHQDRARRGLRPRAAGAGAMRLHSRVYLHSLMVLLVVGAATSLVFAVGGRGGLMREMGERMARHAAGLAAERVTDRAALGARLEQLHADLDVDVVVRDLQGSPLAAAGAPLPSPAPDGLTVARGGHVVAGGGAPPMAVAPVRDPASGAVVATIELAAH